MALMRLLTVGRSLSEVRDSGHRYKLRHGALPVFGNPEGPRLGKKFEVRVAVAGGAKDETNDAVGAKPMTTEAVTEEKAAAKTEETQTGWLKKNPFKSARVAVPRQSVQGELSLDKVKPVRNDLSDSDLELVATAKQVKAEPSVEPAPASAPVAEPEVPLVKAQPVLARVLAMFQRRN